MFSNKAFKDQEDTHSRLMADEDREWTLFGQQATGISGSAVFLPVKLRLELDQFTEEPSKSVTL